MSRESQLPINVARNKGNALFRCHFAASDNHSAWLNFLQPPLSFCTCDERPCSVIVFFFLRGGMDGLNLWNVHLLNFLKCSNCSTPFPLNANFHESSRDSKNWPKRLLNVLLQAISSWSRRARTSLVEMKLDIMRALNFVGPVVAEKSQYFY